MNSPSRSQARPLVLVTAALGLSLAISYVFRGALRLYFSQDDFYGLAGAAGIVHWPAGPWRFAWHLLVFDLPYALAGTNPFPYHLSSLFVHVACSVLLLAFLVQRFAALAALLGAFVFAVHPALFSSVYWISAQGDIWSILFAMCAWRLTRTKRALRWFSLPLFAMSLMSKESTLLLPALLASGRPANSDHSHPAVPDSVSGSHDPKGGARVSVRRVRRIWAIIHHGLDDRLFVCLVLMAAGFSPYLYHVWAHAGDPSTPPMHATPYAFDLGLGAVQNLLTYVGWSVHLPLSSAHGVVDAPEPPLYPVAVVSILAWGTGLLSARLRERGWIFGGMIYCLFLLPVLLLGNHTYRYYLYGPLLGAAVCVSALADAAIEPRASRRSVRQNRSVASRKSQYIRATRARPPGVVIWTSALILIVLLVRSSESVVRYIENRPLRIAPELRGEPIVDRAVIARNAIESLRQAGPQPGTTLLFMSRERLARLARVGHHVPGATPPPNREAYLERNLRAALANGLAVRVFFPEVDSVGFSLRPISGSSSHRYPVYSPNGSLQVFTAAKVESLLGGPTVK